MTEELSVPPILAKLAVDARPSVALARRRFERLVTLLSQPLLWICVVALAARFYQITYHSLWFDEAVSVHWARQPAAEIWRVGTALVQDRHPPLYYLALHYWRLIFGEGDLALRSLGAIAGALAVLPAYGIGRRLAGRAGGWAAAALVAINPFLVWYSQEVRMFMPATTLLFCGLYGILAFFDEGASRAQRSFRWALVALSLAAACYTYLFSALVLPVAALWAMLLGARARQNGRRLALLGLLAVAAAGLLFLPLFLSAWAVSGAEYQSGEPFAGMAGILWTLLKSYTFGRLAWPEPLQTIAGILAGVLVVAGLVIPVTGETGRSRMGGVLLFCLLAIPLFAGGWMLARNRATFAETRYFLFLAPALCLAWGRLVGALVSHTPWWLSASGAAGSGQVLPAAAAFLLLAEVMLAALPVNWIEANRREAWRETAYRIETLAGPRDAVVLYVDYVRTAFERYRRGPQGIFFPFTDPIRDEAQVAPPLDGIAGAGYDAIWLVESHHRDWDPQDVLGRWLGARYPLVTELYPAGIDVRAYALRYRLAALPDGVTATDVKLGGLRWLGCRSGPATTPARDPIFHAPSAWIHVTAYMSAGDGQFAGPLPRVRLVDERGQMWGESLERSGDALHLYPPARWQAGEIVRVDFDVNLNPATPAGRYRLVAQGAGAAEATCSEIEVR